MFPCLSQNRKDNLIYFKNLKTCFSKRLMYCNEPVSEFPKSKDTGFVHVTNMAVIAMFFRV